MNLVRIFITTILLLSPLASFAEDFVIPTQTIQIPLAKPSINAIKPAPKEAIIQENIVTPKPDKIEYYSDLISKFDASINDVNIRSLILHNNNFFIDINDQNENYSSEIKAFNENLDKFYQANVSVAYKNINYLLDTGKYNDTYYMIMAYKLAQIGFYNLSSLAMDKIENKDIWKKYTDSIRKNYFPRTQFNSDDEIFMANLYASINYNNLTQESITDIMRTKRSIRRSDYANYLIATALYIEKDFQKSLTTINRAIAVNPENIEYAVLKIKILSDMGKDKEALKLVKSFNSDNIVMPESITQYESIKALLTSKTEKDALKSKYNLGYYYYLNNENAKALKELTLVSLKNKIPEANTIIGDIYFSEKKYEKARDSYQKNTKIFKRYAPSYVGLGNLAVINKDYKNAQQYYSKANKYSKTKENTLLNLAVIELVNKNINASRDLCSRSLNAKNDYYGAYYLMAKLRPEKKVYNLKKSATSNPFYINTWLDLADYAILDRDYNLAQTYINSARYLANKNSRYYYYVGLMSRINNNEIDAEKNFAKAITLNNNDNATAIEEF